MAGTTQILENDMSSKSNQEENGKNMAPYKGNLIAKKKTLKILHQECLVLPTKSLSNEKKS